MHPRVQETLEYLDAQRAALRDAVELVPAAQRQRQPGPDRWSVAQVLQHLMLIETGIGKLVAKLVNKAKADGLGPEIETSSILNTNEAAKIGDRTTRVTAPEFVRPQSGVDAVSAWSALEQTREILRAAVIAGDGLALSQLIYPHPVLGPINLYQWILFVGSHEARHTTQIREIADELNASSTEAAGGN